MFLRFPSPGGVNVVSTSELEGVHEGGTDRVEPSLSELLHTTPTDWGHLRMMVGPWGYIELI